VVGRVVRHAGDGTAGIAWEMDGPARRRMIALLFSRAPDNIARAGNLLNALRGLLRRLRDPDGRKARA
jgi:hypothetical protein